MSEPMSSLPQLHQLGGKLAVNFANLPSMPAAPQDNSLSWEELILFLEETQIVSAERRDQLLALTESNPSAAHALLSRAMQLRDSLRAIFVAMIEGETVPPELVNAINRVLRITEGHDEVVWTGEAWQMEFVAREDGLEWLLAAVARSAAEILVEGTAAPLRFCANPGCSLFFYDDSRTHRRRWCSMSLCGNRSKVAAFAKRNAAGAGQ